MFYQYTTCKGTYRLIIEHIFIEFVRGAVSRLVGNQRIVIDMLLLVSNHTAVALTFSTLSGECKVELVTGNTVVQGNDIVIYPAVALLIDIDITDAHILMMRLLHAIEVERCILTHIGLNDLRGQEVTIIGSMVTEEHLDLCPFLKDDEYTTVHHQIGHLTLSVAGSGFQDVNHLNGTIDLHVLWYIDQQSILCQHCIESSDGIV